MKQDCLLVKIRTKYLYMRSNFRIYICAALILFGLNLLAQAQTAIENISSKNPHPTSYYSEVDRLLSFKSIVVVPSYDNVGGVYKNSVDNKLKELISQDSSWSLAELKLPSGKATYRADWFDDNSDYTKNTILGSHADALLQAVVTKNSSGLNINLTLYAKDGAPFIVVSYRDEKTFELNKVNEIAENLYHQLKQKLPYEGLIMSRKGNAVTINLGQKYGLKVNDKISVAQILSIKRHPKLRFVTNVEKEVIGQIIVTKVDTDLSFAQISFEKESGVIDRNAKLLPIKFIKYNQPGANMLGSIPGIEDGAQEWVPSPSPQFGKISVALGISDYRISSVDLAGGNSFESAQSFAPTLKIGAELWLTPEWYTAFDIQKSLFNTDNGLLGSTPGTLSFDLNRYDILFGYRYSITGNFWGPQLNIGLGYFLNQTHVTDSAPVSFTSTEVSGWNMQVGGYFPITDDYKTSVGAKAKFVFFERYSETPVDSGKAATQFNNFGIYVAHQISTNIQLRPEINYGITRASFSGAANRLNPVRSTDEKFVSYMLGLDYLF